MTCWLVAEMKGHNPHLHRDPGGSSFSDKAELACHVTRHVIYQLPVVLMWSVLGSAARDSRAGRARMGKGDINKGTDSL